MVYDIWASVVNVVYGPVLWFTELLSAIDGVGLFLSAVVLLLIIRYFVYPIVGHRGSDVSKKYRNGREGN